MKNLVRPVAAALLIGSVSLSAAPTAKPAPSNKLKWSTASEVDNYGFFVFRGDSKEGPFKQLNPKAIPGANNSDVPSKYEFEDKDVVDGRTYYYYLESISVQGVRERFSPVLSKVCCQRPEAAKVEGDGHAAPAPVPSPSPSPSPSPEVKP